MSVNYKTLFEVKLMHEFYLTDRNGNTVFQIPSQAERLDFLFDQYSPEKESIDNDIEFLFPEEYKEEYANHNLKLLSTFSGFKIAIRIKKKILTDGTTVYEPFVPLPGKLAIHVLLSKRNNNIENLTNKRIQNPLPAIYLFSNNKFIDQPGFPFLTHAVSSIRGGYNYEQGELVAFGSDIAGYYSDGSLDEWNIFPGSYFANENDRLLLPLKFNYTFPNDRNINEVTFTLKNTNGDTIKSFTKNSDRKLDKVGIDFSGLQQSLTAPLTAGYPDFVFSLEVFGNDGYNVKHFVFFDDNMYNKNIWAVASIHVKTLDTDSDLLATDGYLKKRIKPSGDKVENPVFEIPVKSRYAYLRYINNKGYDLEVDPILHPELIKYLSNDILKENGEDRKILISRKPKSLAQSFFLLKENGGGEKYFPNPLALNIQQDKEKRKLCYDIIVTESPNFPLA